MAVRVVARVGLLAIAPIVSMALFDGSLSNLAAVSSLIAIGLDQLRQKKKCLPFPIFLMLVYATQATFYLIIAQTAHFSTVSRKPVDLSAPDWNLQQSVSSEASLGRPPARKIETMSIVLAAHNEQQYIKRTLDSIYERTPAEVLKEIIVVDDGSSPPMIESMRDHPEVKVIRHEQRKGLIKSKTIGGNAAQGDMIMFLDAHIKPDWGWSEPLFRHMNINYKRVVVPLIPILDGKTWQENLNAVGVKMMFDWTLFFQWFEDFNDLVPCMSGGLFGITRDWWHESGEYDYEMNMWGAENIEQSIRIWLCGGEIYVARDSRVSHVFRASFPYKINNTEIYINKVRTVETWFDEYKENFYQADPAARQFKPYMGDISERKALQSKLQCKPFKTYIEKFYNVFREKHMVPEEIFLIRDKVSNLCIQVAKDQEHVEEAECRADDKRQHWTVGNGGQGLNNNKVHKCFDANAGQPDKVGSPAFLYACFLDNVQQKWSLKNGHIRWTDTCIKAAENGLLQMDKCGGEFLGNEGPFEKFQSRVAIA